MKKIIVIMIIISISCLLFSKKVKVNHYDDYSIMGLIYPDEDNQHISKLYYNVNLTDSLLYINYGLIYKTDNQIIKVNKINVSLKNNQVSLVSLYKLTYVTLYDWNNIDNFKVAGHRWPPFRKEKELSGNYYMIYHVRSKFIIKESDLRNTTFLFEYEYQTKDGIIKGFHSAPLLDLKIDRQRNWDGL